MGHPPRVFVADMSLHVIRRGVNRCTIAACAADFEALLDAFRTAAEMNAVSVHAYGIMDTHYHALATPSSDGALSAMMKMFGEGYVGYFNKKYERIGTLWTGRFRSLPMQDEKRWLDCLRYIEMNPVAAKMVERPEAYRWSSYRFHACGEPSDWLVPHPVYLALGRTPEERQALYRAFCARQGD